MTAKHLMRLLWCAVTASFLAATPAVAQGYPSRSLTFVVPYAPGGISDILARSVSAVLEKELGQSVVVVNKPSPGIVVGLSEVAKAAPDGYTIGIWVNSAYVFPLVMKTPVPYDGVESFTFLRSYGDFVVGVAVKSDSRFKTFQDLIETGKANPGKLKYGSIGANSGQHLMMEETQKVTGAKFVHVPQTGTAANIANVLGGHLDFLSDASSWAPNVRQGQLRLLAISGAKRNPSFPDVPTFAEQGVKAQLWGRGAIVAPAKLPDAIKTKLEAALDKAFQDPKVQEATAGIAQIITSIPGDEMREFAIKDREVWKKLIAEAQ